MEVVWEHMLNLHIHTQKGVGSFSYPVEHKSTYTLSTITSHLTVCIPMDSRKNGIAFPEKLFGSKIGRLDNINHHHSLNSCFQFNDPALIMVP